jgi:hypothetical protein
MSVIVLPYDTMQIFPETIHEDSEEGAGAKVLCFHPYFDILHQNDGRVVSSTLRPHFTPNKTTWYSFLLGAEWGQCH